LSNHYLAINGNRTIFDAMQTQNAHLWRIEYRRTQQGIEGCTMGMVGLYF
jgi:hypothetical protein